MIKIKWSIKRLRTTLMVLYSSALHSLRAWFNFRETSSAANDTLLQLTNLISLIFYPQAPIFEGLGEGFLRMLSLNIKPMLYLPTQIIITRGDVGHQMFFIHRGEVEVTPHCSKRWHWPDAGLMLGRRRGRWPNIRPVLSQRLVFSGTAMLMFVRNMKLIHQWQGVYITCVYRERFH